MSAGMLFAADGCVLPNLTTLREYRLTFGPVCPHGKIRSASVVIQAESEADARHYAETWLRLGVLRRVAVTEVEAL
jgi:hypothetical protein